MRYRTLLFDLDHTLLDSDESEREAYRRTMTSIGLDDPAAHFERYVAINRAMWAEVEAGTMRPDDVRHARFDRFVRELGIDADPSGMAETFVRGLAESGGLYEGVREVLDTLAETAMLGMVTNGLSDVQRTRIDRLDLGRYFDTVVISSEVGVTKPRPEIFELAFDGLGRPDPDTALMIGDSLTSDIEGGYNFGIDTCWFHRNGTERSAGFAATHVISDLADLPAIVRGEG